MPRQGRSNGPEPAWPELGDSLLAGGEEWETLAALSYWPPDGFLHYAMSYKEAGDAVVESIERTGRGADSMVYALLFLYRHYVELMLKGLIKMGVALQKEKPSYPQCHRIDVLWRDCSPVLERAFPEGDRPDTAAVENCMRELARMDPTGEAFRYPEDKRGKAIRHQISRLSLRNVREIMDKIAGYLEGSYDGLDGLLQAQSDLDSYYEPS